MVESRLMHAVPEEIVVRIAKVFDIDVQRVSAAAGGFSGASVYRVEAPDNRLFAVRKTHVTSTMPEARMMALHRLLRAVSRQGLSVVPVPIEPVRNRFFNLHGLEGFSAGESWVKIASEVWQAEPWMPGAPADRELTNEQLQSALKCLHLFHEAAGRAVSTASLNEWFNLTSGASPGLIRRLTIATELSDGFLKTLRVGLAADPDPEFRALALRICELLASWLPWLLIRLTQISKQSFRLQPVLRDLWRAHVLFTQDRVTGLIDFSAMANDHVSLDLSRLLRSWFAGDVRRIRDAAQEFSLLRPLDQSEWTLLEAFDASTVLLSPVTWLRRRFASGDRAPCRSEILIRLTELTEIAERFRPLTG